MSENDFKNMTAEQIEIAIYGKGGYYERTVKKIESMSQKEVCKRTGQSRQRILGFRQQFREPDKFDYKPKLETIKKIAESLGVE